MVYESSSQQRRNEYLKSNSPKNIKNVSVLLSKKSQYDMMFFLKHILVSIRHFHKISSLASKKWAISKKGNTLNRIAMTVENSSLIDILRVLVHTVIIQKLDEISVSLVLNS